MGWWVDDGCVGECVGAWMGGWTMDGWVAERREERESPVLCSSARVVRDARVCVQSLYDACV